jgi:hypothetical protein
MHLIELLGTTSAETLHRVGLDGAVSAFELHLVELEEAASGWCKWQNDAPCRSGVRL